MKKEILLLSSLISLALVFYFGLPNKKNIQDNEKKIENKTELNDSLVDEILNEDVLLKFDLVRLEPSGDVIIAGKTEPEIKIDIFDGNEKLSSVISDSHGDWVWISEKRIEKGIKRFRLQHTDTSGKIISSEENIIVFFEKDASENQKVVKITNKNIGIEILNNNEINGLALDTVEHFENNKLRIKGRSYPNSKVQFSLSEKIVGKTTSKNDGSWEFLTNEVEFNEYDLKIESFFQNHIITLKTKILDGNIDEELFLEKKFIVEDGNSL